MLYTIRWAVLGTRLLLCSFISVASLAISFGPGSNVTWAQCEETAELLAADGAVNDRLGQSVSISGDVLVVGAHLDDDSGTSAGSAYVFRRRGSSWIEDQKLNASDAAGGDFFGVSVAVEGDVAVVGAKGVDDNGTTDVGAAYIFRKSGSNWVEEQKLFASDGARIDLFGNSVAISGDTVVVGAYIEGNGGAAEDGRGAELLPKKRPSAVLVCLMLRVEVHHAVNMGCSHDTKKPVDHSLRSRRYNTSGSEGYRAMSDVWPGFSRRWARRTLSPRHTRQTLAGVLLAKTGGCYD